MSDEVLGSISMSSVHSVYSEPFFRSTDQAAAGVWEFYRNE